MSLLTPEDILAFKSAIKQVTDTFNKVPVKIIQRSKKVTVFNQSRKDTNTNTEYNLFALSIYDTQDTGSEPKKSEAGSLDMTEGYLLFNFEDLDAAGLIGAAPDYSPLIVANRDTVEFYGKVFEIEGVNLTGPVEDKYALVKLHFKRRKHGGQG